MYINWIGSIRRGPVSVQKPQADEHRRQPLDKVRGQGTTYFLSYLLTCLLTQNTKQEAPITITNRRQQQPPCSTAPSTIPRPNCLLPEEFANPQTTTQSSRTGCMYTYRSGFTAALQVSGESLKRGVASAKQLQRSAIIIQLTSVHNTSTIHRQTDP